MSERPKWMPSDEDVEEQSDLHIGWVDDEAMQFLYRIGLRAQIAALDEIAANDMPVVSPVDPSRYIFSAVTKVTVLNKIAALRKELGE